MKQKRLKLIVFVFLWSILLLGSAMVAEASPQLQIATCEEATIHYHRPAGDYEDWGLHIWGPTAVTGVTWTEPFMPTGEDDFGLVWTVPMQADADYLNYIVHLGDEKDPGPDQQMSFATTGCEIWLMQGDETQFPSPDVALQGVAPELVVDLTDAPEVGENQAIIHYRRSQGDYTGWGLHVWGPTPLVQSVSWGSPLQPAGQDNYGLYFVIDVNEDAETVNYIVHKGEEKDPGPDQTLNFAEHGREIWLIQGSETKFSSPEDALAAAELASVGDISKLKAYWVSQDLIVYPTELNLQNTYALVFSPDAEIRVTPEGLAGAEVIPLKWMENGLPSDLAAKFPHLTGYEVFQIPEDQLDLVPDILRGQAGVANWDSEGGLQDLTGVQIPGVLDDLFAYDGPLGITWDGEIPSFHLWAPTAKRVTMYLYPDSNPKTQGIPVPMSFERETGVWSKTGKETWYGQYYRFRVEVYVPSEGSIVSHETTDPYSFGLSMNSTHSMIIDLNDPALIPDGWDELEKPAVNAPEDIVLYELHVRDFSAFDESVPEGVRGTFAAFAEEETNGVQHLQRLANAGVTHIHLLPAFDIATINEDQSTWLFPNPEALAGLPPDSDEQQALVNQTRADDPFNWGYDPLHYTVPEGSYSTNPSDGTRILEFRQMVMALNEMGLRVVMDVVYNHTNAFGLVQNSVLDKIVPGYYHRLNSSGVVESSTCCANTASEHVMMERLMIDSVLTWTTAYKVDGYRFDLMGHHMQSNMLKLREALDALSVEEDGVDGQAVYVYGEGWNFGEVVDNARGVNATQVNMAGSGIGTFNDRGRDAARGGNPFGGLQEQGFINGLYSDPNEVESRTPEAQKATLLEFSDILRVTLAGNLASYSFTSSTGELTTGADVLYNGSPRSGYTADPQENIVYVSAHDNETLFDAIQYKAPLGTSMEDRVRMQNMGVSLVALSQGVPFFHAGTELLRSKNMDRDSYDSGDWFNQLDFTYQQNNWGHGLPIADKNSGNWEIIAPLLANPDLKPGPEHIQAALNHFTEMLEIRASSPLFHLQTAEDILLRVQFHNTGVNQVPGMIVMSIDDRSGVDLDDDYDYILVLFNATDERQTFMLGDGVPVGLTLHPIQTASADAIVRDSAYQAEDHSLIIPARTTAVFVVEQEEEAVPDETVSPDGDSGPLPVEEEKGGLPLTAMIGISAVGILVLAGIGWVVYKQMESSRE
jgi:pullulanase